MYPLFFTFNNNRYWVFFIIEHEEKEYDSQIKSFLQDNYRPDHVICILPHSQYKTSQLALNRIGNTDSYILTRYAVNEHGTFINVDANRKRIESSLYEKIKNELFNNIFSKYETVLKASEHSYFLLPNDRISTSFVRIGNTLKCSLEVGALSIFLLPYIKNDPTNIYCDSPSIFPIIYSTVLLKNIINKKTYLPIIKSFNTHGFLMEDIENTTSMLFLISMTVSGSLPTKINNNGYNWKDILILYNFFKKSVNSYNILLDYSSENINHNHNIEEYDIKTFKEKFPERTFEIKFDSDQFLPTAPHVSQIKLTTADAPQWLSPFISRYRGFTDFIACYKGKNSKDNTRDLYLDISKILLTLSSDNPNYFEEKTYKLLVNNLPLNLKGLVYLDSDESKYIADLIHDYYKQNFNLIIPLYKPNELVVQTTLVNEPSNYLVCVSCVSEGKKISNVSRILRKLVYSQITYFCGIVRCKSNDALKELRSNLTYGRYSFGTYNLITIEEIFLPNEDSLTLSWEQEKDFLEKLLSMEGIIPDTDLSDEDRLFFSERLVELTKGNLTNNVFLKNTKNEVMLLNRNFAFFNFYEWEPKDIQQCIVYFAILSVFHNHRLKNKIAQNVFERHLLAPENFNRFNDGIIQAALLRTAQAEELKYSIDLKSSEMISDLIINLIKNEKTEDSAPLEFLLALCTGKMTLIDSHYLKIYNTFQQNNVNSTIKVLLEVINQKFIKTF